MIYHIARRTDWEAAPPDGYRSASLATEGFIHCSTREQVCGSAQRHFQGQTDLVLLCIDETRLVAPLRWEGAAAPFPHIYGPLNADAVIRTVPFHREPDGTFRLPPNAKP